MELIFCLVINGEIYGKSNNTKIDIEESLNKKIKCICSFCNTTIIIENRGLETIYRENLTYVKIIKDSKFCSYDIIILKGDSIL